MAIRNGQSSDTGNIRHTRHWKKANRTKKKKTSRQTKRK